MGGLWQGNVLLSLWALLVGIFGDEWIGAAVESFEVFGCCGVCHASACVPTPPLYSEAPRKGSIRPLQLDLPPPGSPNFFLAASYVPVLGILLGFNLHGQAFNQRDFPGPIRLNDGRRDLQCECASKTKWYVLRQLKDKPKVNLSA